MNHEDIDSINHKLYMYEVPNDPIKQIMFYFAVIHEIIDYPFPENFINFENPYFSSYEEMEEFLALLQTLNPEFLYYNSAFIYHNDKNYYEYYRINNDQEGIPYEFKVVDIQESTNPIFNSNYKNFFNISNIDKRQIEFNVSVSCKANYLHSKKNNQILDEENYLDEKEKGYDIFCLNNNQDDSINEINDYEYGENDKQQSVNYNALKKFCKDNDKLYDLPSKKKRQPLQKSNAFRK